MASPSSSPARASIDELLGDLDPQLGSPKHAGGEPEKITASTADGGSTSVAADVTASSATTTPPFAPTTARVTIASRGDERFATGANSRTEFVANWNPSNTSLVLLRRMTKEGYIVKGKWRISKDEPEPKPKVGECVILTSHITRGMGFPPSAFFLDILNLYGVQPHNISPNSILYLASFQALFEGYLGMTPDLGFWQYCFEVKHNISHGVSPICGTISFTLRKFREEWYPKIEMPEPDQSWLGSFFYHQDIPFPGKTTGFPPFVNSAAIPRESWTTTAVENLPENLMKIKRRIAKLSSSQPSLIGKDTVMCWFGRRIQPLSFRSRLLCEYQGPEDSMRGTDKAFTKKDFIGRLHQLVAASSQIEESLAIYHVENPVPKFDELGENDLASDAELNKLHAEFLNNRKRKRPAIKEESIPILDDTRIKEEPFDELGYIRPEAKKFFAPAPLIRPWPQNGLVIRNDIAFSPRQVIHDGLHHVGILFAEYAKEFHEVLTDLRGMSQHSADAINLEVLKKLSLKSKEVKTLQSVIETTSNELASTQRQLSKATAALNKANKLAENNVHVSRLREENSNLRKELLKVQEDLEASNLALGIAQSKASLQAAEDKSVINDLESMLLPRMKESDEIDKVLGNFPGISRTEKIRAFGEVWNSIRNAGMQLISKFLPTSTVQFSEVYRLPGAITEVAESKESILRSAARGGARMALGLMRLHYPNARSWRVASGIPQGYTEAQCNAIFDEVKGHASKIASMVNISITYPEEEVPAAPENDSSDEDSDA